MRFRIKQYNSWMKKKLWERHYLIKKRATRWRDGFLEKGHEKMTVMFIPHNEKKIFNFHISKFTVLFFIALFFVVVLTSSYAIIRNASIKSEKDRLLSDYKDVRSHLVRFEKLTNEIADLVDDIKPDIEYVYELSRGDNDVYKIWETSAGDPKESGEISKMKDIFPEEIFLLKDLQTDLVCTTQTVKTIKNFIDVRSRVITDTPSIIPNLGHISSLFGWRRSPFGFGRDFHTGIDIAAAPGEPIKATAPGIVTTVGWGGGYGWMVKIDHKYGFQTLYGHCKVTACRVGQEIKKGQIVAYVGQTGSATGNHCHYEIRLGGSPINPYPYMSKIW
ncbi:MAG: peptidoglycan DD-metalloendopeptidase family protein [Spirochaetes bacterium]|jgi:hypothetical protein|nr:peptidoglycan DD-metalloendopeptidase family protein [Spirochaetota bacterium]